MNGPVPTMLSPWPWAYLLSLSGTVSALSLARAAGLWMPNGWIVWLSRKFDCGFFRTKTTVEASLAVTETMLASAPKPPKTAP